MIGQGYMGLEWTLFALNVITFATTVTLIILVSITLCSRKPANMNTVNIICTLPNVD